MTKIMLVEDDNNLREIYEARLAAEGYEIVSAQDGEAALAMAAKERPDLVITDVMMPKISGFEMLDILRNTENLRDVKVIMLTALGQAEDNARANTLGADRYLVKSQVTLEDIVKATHEVIEGVDAQEPMPAGLTAATAAQSDDAAAPTDAPDAASVTSPATVPADDTAETAASEPAEPATPPAQQPRPIEITTPDDTTDDDAQADVPTASPEVAADAKPAVPMMDLPDVPVPASGDVITPEIQEEPSVQTDNVTPPTTADTTDNAASTATDTDTPVAIEPSQATPTDEVAPAPETDTPAVDASMPSFEVTPVPGMPDLSSYNEPPTESASESNQSVTEPAEPVNQEAAPAAEEESVMRDQIDQFLNQATAEDAAVAEQPAQETAQPDVVPAPETVPPSETPSVPAAPVDTPENVVAEPAQPEVIEPAPLADEPDDVYDKDAAIPDMGEMEIHVEPGQPGTEAPAAVPNMDAAPAPDASQPAQPSADFPAPAETPGYPSQPFEIAPLPGASMSENNPIGEPETVAPEPEDLPSGQQSAGDKVVSDAINDMLATTPESAAKPLLSPSEQAAAANRLVSPENPSTEPQLGAPSVTRKTINPLDSQARPDINQLLAAEDAKIAAVQAGAAYPPQTPSTQPAAPQPNQPWQPLPVSEQPRQSKYGEDIDPNSISL